MREGHFALMSSSDTPPTPKMRSTPKRSNTKAIILVAAILVVGVAVLLRFTLSLPKAATETPSPAAHLTGAPPFGTATPVTSSGNNQASGGSYLSASTPYATPYLSGYSNVNPSVDTAQEQALRAQDGNPTKVIMVSLSGQFLQAFDHGKIVKWTYVTTGRPELATPTGFFQIGYKLTPFTFEPISKDPHSVEFGFPSKVQYAIEFAAGGYYIHDVWWRTVYGPGLNMDHYDPGRAEYSPGSHGCVNTPLPVVQFLFFWAPVGTPVIVFQ
jgi:lipoprotein-anchoring transpeptidase ErfK/SrfK